jgi:hypothetical protein
MFPVRQVDVPPFLLGEGMPEKIKGVLLETTSYFGEGYPKNIPLAEGITLESLTEGDDKPFFLTLPVGEVNTVSRNNRRYPREAVESIRNAVVTKRVGGILGHLRDEDRPYDYQTSAIHWVGAVIEGSTLWAKGYIPKTEPKLREEMRIAMMKRGRVGTSIYGTALVDEEGNVLELDVESIDIAHPDRVGVPMTAAMPLVTSETVSEGEARTPVFEGAEFGARIRRAVYRTVEDTPGWDEIMSRMADAAGISLGDLFQILNSTDTAAIPDSYLQAWATILNVSLEELRRLAGVQVSEDSGESAKENNMAENTTTATETALDELKRQHQQEIRALEAKLGENRNKLADYDELVKMLANPRDVVTAVRVIQQTVDDLKRENGDLLKETIVLKVQDKVLVETARPLIVTMVEAEKPATKRAVEMAFENVLARPEVKELLRAGVTQEMGGRHETPATPTTPTVDPVAETLRITIPGVN